MRGTLCLVRSTLDVAVDIAGFGFQTENWVFEPVRPDQPPAVLRVSDEIRPDIGRTTYTKVHTLIYEGSSESQSPGSLAFCSKSQGMCIPNLVGLTA